MDLLARARALAACPLFATLAPAVILRLAERAHARALAAGAPCTTEARVWIVAAGALTAAATGATVAGSLGARTRGAVAGPGDALGVLRVIAPTTPPVLATALEPSMIVGLDLDDVRDVLEEDPAALAALATAVAALLLGERREAEAP